MEHSCKSVLWLQAEVKLGNSVRTCLYFLGLAYCFVGLSAITARFFRSMESVVMQTREVIYVDSETGSKIVKRERIWNYTIADISLLAFGTSFPQISLAIIDALRNLGQRYAGGLGPGTLVGSAAFDLYPIHAVCVVVPTAGTIKKISDLGVWFVELLWSFWAYVWLYIILQVWTPEVVTIAEAGLTVIQFCLLLLHAYAQDKGWKYIALPFPRQERPEDWVPVDTSEGKCQHEYNKEIPECEPSSPNEPVDIFSIHYTPMPDSSSEPFLDEINHETWSPKEDANKPIGWKGKIILAWIQQFKDIFIMEDDSSSYTNKTALYAMKILWKIILLPWRFLFAFVPPCEIAHGWVAFISSLCFITVISFVLTKLTDLISCVTGINPYVIAFTALASGTSWPDLVASKIAAERQETADSAIANITCR
eukprot:TRINITY_DN3422_c0_g1_i1.p1 TRINITY_DN3422_c0_g1~~TRINITY_DN3422_c0_g1_i1.p1  ORF type:complete len:423 (+),score=66.32 TRINITY_DN3422_c0_g1_i1:465-1733(+)